MPSSPSSPNEQSSKARRRGASGAPAAGVGPATRAGRWLAHHRGILLIAFAFTVMADPVSSVAYAIEAALRALGGNLSLLLPTMAVVIGIIAVVIANYNELVARFPQGGGAAAAAGTAFGEGFAFLPLGALVVDFVLTIAISVAAGTSAIVAYFPTAHAIRVPLALGLLLLVAALTWFGHWGRILFALMTLSFVGISAALLASGFAKPQAAHAAAAGHSSGFALFSVMLAFPVGMALATGVEAPSSAIAQLGQLDDDGRRFFGRVTLWLTLLVVGGLTLGITALAVRLGIGIPPAHSTQIGDVARVAGGPALFALFQAATAVLLLAAASSSFQAGPGLLKALAHTDRLDGSRIGILPAWMGRTNQPPHSLLGRARLPAGVGGRHRRGGRARPGAGPLLRGRRVHEFPRRPAGHAEILVRRAQELVARVERHRRRACRVHSHRESAARLPARVARGRAAASPSPSTDFG